MKAGYYNLIQEGESDLTPLVIKEVLNKVGNGITDPFYCSLEDGRSVVFKAINNPEGKRVLVNEWVAYKIACKLEMPIMEAGTAAWTKDTTVSDVVMDSLEKGVENHYGLGFYSVWDRKCTQLTSPAMLGLIKNRDAIPRIVMLDMLICNKDRNPGNLLVEMKKGNKDIRIIDHTHIFDIGALWDHNQLLRLIHEDHKCREIVESNSYIYDKFFENYSFSHTELHDICDDFRGKLSKVEINDIIKGIPKEWGLSETDGQGLYQYISHRLDSLHEMVAEII